MIRPTFWVKLEHEQASKTNSNRIFEYERIFESTSICFFAMSNRCRRLSNAKISLHRLKQMR